MLLGEHAAHQAVDRLFVHAGDNFFLARAGNLERLAPDSTRALACYHAHADGDFIVGAELARARHHHAG